MKTINRSRYRTPRSWPLYRTWHPYVVEVPHKHKWCRISGDGAADTIIICVQCGETA